MQERPGFRITHNLTGLGEPHRPNRAKNSLRSPCAAITSKKLPEPRSQKQGASAPPGELRPNSRKRACTIGDRNISFFSTAKVSAYPPRHPVVCCPADLRPDLEGFVTRIGVTIQHGGDRNSYNSARAESRLPGRATFVGALASTDTESFYPTLPYELTHWTAPAQRCDRDLSGRFGSAAYGIEELVVELGAVILCADLGLSSPPHLDYA